MNILVSTGQSLEQLLGDLKIYPQSLKNVAVTNKDAILAHEGLQNLIEELEANLGENGRILVRASGTESLVRVMAEAPTFEECDRVVSALVNYINEISY
ncbi:MAG: hypothetical protein NTV44_05955 [Firmicutes bacterium]|nr:hypothetical protein [Bacillota bacterium]